MTQPPPLPPQRPNEIGHLGQPQKVFDTVTGPNLRLKDNLFQLACLAVAVPVGIGIAYFFIRDLTMALLIGILGGLIGGILVSGAILGIYRGAKAVKK
jgi:hypothetical protein